MLQDIRKSSQGTVAKVVVGLIVISFALFGVESILLGGSGNSVGSVNGEDISPGELQQTLNTQKRRLAAMMGDNLDPSLLDDDRLKGQVMESIISRKLLMQSAAELKLAVSEKEVGSLIGNMEQFQVDGKFSKEAYKSIVAGAGYTPSFFKQSIKDDLMLNQLRGGLAGSDFATPGELELNARVVSEQRDLRYVTIPQESQSVDFDITDEEITVFYSVNEAMFLTEETVDIDYIELGPDDFKEPVAEEAIMDAYELAVENFQSAPQVRVSHILFEEDGEGASQQRIEKALAKLDAGAEFAEVAGEFSEDIGSAGRGGDLGYSNGDAFPPEIEAAVAGLELGVVSVVVESDAGSHLLLVTERNQPEVPTLEGMRDQLQESLQAEEARVVLLRTVESLKDLTFNADDLQAPAEELALTVEQATAVGRNAIDGLFAHPSLIGAAFSEEVLVAGHNSEVIELAGEQFLVLRVREHNTPEVLPMESVRATIIAAIQSDKTRQALMKEAQNALAAIQSGTSLEELALARGYQWQVELGVDRRSPTVAPEVLRRIFELPVPAENDLPADVVFAGNGDAIVVQLARVTQGDYATLGTETQRQLKREISNEYGGLIDGEYQRGLRQNADISIF